jgi:hypothetical protein
LHAQALKTLFLTNLDNLESKKPEKANFASLAFTRKSSKKPKSQKPKARGVPALPRGHRAVAANACRGARSISTMAPTPQRQIAYSSIYMYLHYTPPHT